MRTGIPLFNVLNQDYSTYNGKGKKWPLPKNRQPAEWVDAEDEDDVMPGDLIEQEPGQAFGTGSGGVAGYFLTGPSNIMSWYRPGARLYLAEGKGALHRRRQHVIYAKARLLREITLNDGLIDTWPEAYMFCLLTARDRGEIKKIDCYRYDFSGIKLRGVDLRNATFDGCKFTATSLEDCWFDGSSMRHCNFNRADLYNAKFRDCDLTGTSFRQANLFHTDFSGANLTGAVTHLAQIGYTVLKDAKLDQGQAIEFPEKIEAAVAQVHSAGYAVVPGSQDAHAPLADWELTPDGETVENNYHGAKKSDSI